MKVDKYLPFNFLKNAPYNYVDEVSKQYAQWWMTIWGFSTNKNCCIFE